MPAHSLSANRIRNAGFTAIETMVVTGIIGLVSAVALPIYQDYTTRAELTEMVSSLSSAKTAITESVATTGRISADLAVPFAADNDKISAVAVYRYEKCPSRGGIEVEMGDSIDPALQGKRLRLDYQGQGQWHCGGGNTAAIDDELLPQSCRNTVPAAPAECGAIEYAAIAIDSASLASNSFGDAEWTRGYGTGNSSAPADTSTANDESIADATDETTLEWEQTVASIDSDFDYSASNDTVTTTATVNAGGSAIGDGEQGCEDSMGGAAESGSHDAMLTAEAASDCTV